MQDTSGSGIVQDTSEGTFELEENVRNSVAAGDNVQKEVRDLTVKALSKQKRDPESLRHVMTAVMKGVGEGVQQKMQQTTGSSQTLLEPVRDAVAGLDAALAHLAEASKLALEEAAGRAQKFSNEDLRRVRTDLESMETLFVETLERSASAAQDLVSETLSDLAQHARRNGTAVGSQLKDTLTAFSHQMAVVGQNQLEAGIELTHAITNLMREAAADALAGIAARVKPESSRGSNK